VLNCRIDRRIDLSFRVADYLKVAMYPKLMSADANQVNEQSEDQNLNRNPGDNFTVRGIAGWMSGQNHRHPARHREDDCSS